MSHVGAGAVMTLAIPLVLLLVVLVWGVLVVGRARRRG